MPEAKGSAFSKGRTWSGGAEDSAMTRTQQFIVDAHQHPVVFQISEAPISAEVPYPPINDANLVAANSENRSRVKSNTSSDGIASTSTSAAVYTTADTSSPALPSSSKDLFPHRLSLHPPKEASEKGAGLINKGNTCYMNSTLQAILHLPPLLHALLSYDDAQLYGMLGGRPLHKFDAIGELVSLAERLLTKRGGGQPIAPMAFLTNLKSYARTLSKFRQEDAHEFLRFLMEAMQQCCLLRAPKSMKPNDPVRETTLIHKIFGGKLRSRVQCQRCKHNSDTFDPILDLSLDLRKSSSVNEALEKFTSVDVLTGSEKYRCEKCKKAVDATKGFTIHEAPMVLTIHLKRFTLSGQKITRQIHYPDSLVLTRDMLSEGHAPQHYKLRSIVHHHGNSPNSGHYVATVKGNSGNRWYEMNDSSVYPARGIPINMSDAYILFYVRDPNYALSSAVSVNHKNRVGEGSEFDNYQPKRQEGTSPTVSLLMKKPLVSSSPSIQQQRHTSSINPASFYASPAPLKTSSPSSAAFKSKSPMFRNLDTAGSDDDDGDDVGEAVSSTARVGLQPNSDGFISGSKKRKHRDSLHLGARGGNQKSRHIPHSPFKKVGQDTLQRKPFHARMKTKHGTQFRS